MAKNERDEQRSALSEEQQISGQALSRTACVVDTVAEAQAEERAHIVHNICNSYVSRRSMAIGDTQTQQPQPVISLYEGSTQFRNWRFSQADLTLSRVRHNHGAIAVIKSNFETNQPGSSEGIQFLTPEEELLLVRLYATKIPQLCAAFKFPEEVEAIAITYLKRFYLKNTVMDWHPKNVMLTALFLATKTTNNPISIEAYTSRIPKTTPADVLDLEFLVAQSLNFEFAVWCAHRALWGTYLDLQTLDDPPSNIDDIYTHALRFVRHSRISDVEFIYTPSQIALAAMHLHCKDATLQWAGSKGLDIQQLEQLALQIQNIVAKDGVAPDVETVREVDRRLRTCKNPDKAVGSPAFEQKKAEEDAEKRVSKALAAKRSMEDQDPFKFGGNLRNGDN